MVKYRIVNEKRRLAKLKNSPASSTNNNNNNADADARPLNKIEAESMMAHYETYDDYLEMSMYILIILILIKSLRTLFLNHLFLLLLPLSAYH